MAHIRTRLAAMGVAGVLAAGATLSALSPALAQNASETPPAPETEQTQQTPGEKRQERRAAREAAFATALAAELDLPAERVQAAVQKVHEQMRAEARQRHLAALKERLDAAVEDGTLTREQADAIYAAAESGALPHHGSGRHGGHRRGHHAPPAVDGAGDGAEAEAEPSAT